MTSRHISVFADLTLEDRPAVGGKGGSLGELTRAGIDVPPGFVVRTESFEHFIQALEREAPLRTAAPESPAPGCPAARDPTG